MARIFVSYQHSDKEIVNRIKNELQTRGHDVLMDETVTKIGQDWRKVLFDSLKNADGLLVLISQNSVNSQYVASEVGVARAFVNENSNKKFIIPVVYGDIPIPGFIEDLYCVKLTPQNFTEAIDQINSSITNFFARKEAAEEKESSQRQRIESRAADYILDATNALRKRERHNRNVAYVCYLLGIATLIYGAAIAVSGLNALSDLQTLLEEHPNQVWGIYTLAILKSLIIIGLLVACSKYSFTLGKSFMHESLRNADRIHAISFGQFFINAYGDKITSPNDVKDIFQHWNIDNSSAFSNLTSETYDPKFSEQLVEIIKTLSGKVKQE